MIPHVEPFYGKKERQAVNRYLLGKGYLTEHKITEEFEKKLAEFLGVKYVSLVPSGTVAIYLALLASGLPKGSRVAVPDLTMIATYNAVIAAGMQPILVDVDSQGCLELSEIKTKVDGLIYVELNGRSARMDGVVKYCKKNKIVLIEDACQALGSQYKDKNLGTFGRFGCFSLGFHKIITTGQGGFIVTHTKKDYETIERLKDHGRLKGGNDIHDNFGLNFKYTDLQAAFGLEQLKTIKWRMQKKRQIYKWYKKEEAPEGYVPWFIETYIDGYISWFIEIYVDNLENKFKKLNKMGIGCRKMYPPLHTQKYIDSSDEFPIAEAFSKQILWMPSSLSLTKKEVDFINENL